MATEKPASRSMSKHAFMMILCCLIPVGLFAVLWAVGLPGRYLGFGVMLLCPLLHIVMMRGMMHKHGHGGKSSGEKATPTEPGT